MSKAKRRLKKKVEPTSLFTEDKEKVELDLRSSNSANHLGLSTLSNSGGTTDNTLITLGLGSNTSRAASLRAGPSVQTMSTQLSDESQANYGVTNNPNFSAINNPNLNDNNNNRRPSFHQRTRRAPSEDCVAEDFSGRDGLGRERGQVV